VGILVEMLKSERLEFLDVWDVEMSDEDRERLMDCICKSKVLRELGVDGEYGARIIRENQSVEIWHVYASGDVAQGILDALKKNYRVIDGIVDGGDEINALMKRNKQAKEKAMCAFWSVLMIGLRKEMVRHMHNPGQVVHMLHQHPDSEHFDRLVIA